MSVYEVKQEFKRVASVRADGPGDALILARQKFEKDFGYMEEVRYTVMLLPQPMPEMAGEMKVASEERLR